MPWAAFSLMLSARLVLASSASAPVASPREQHSTTRCSKWLQRQHCSCPILGDARNSCGQPRGRCFLSYMPGVGVLLPGLPTVPLPCHTLSPIQQPVLALCRGRGQPQLPSPPEMACTPSQRLVLASPTQCRHASHAAATSQATASSSNVVWVRDPHWHCPSLQEQFGHPSPAVTCGTRLLASLAALKGSLCPTP